MEPFDSAWPLVGLAVCFAFALFVGFWRTIRSLWEELWVLRKSGPYGPGRSSDGEPPEA